jgi:hypothetical protein
VTGQARAAEARRLAVATMLAVIDGRDRDLHELLDDANRDTLAVAVGGLALAVGAAFSELAPERRVALRGGLAALRAERGRVDAMTPDEQQRLLLGLLLAAHDSDEAGFTALLDGLPRVQLRSITRSLAEVVVGGQLAAEDSPGSARARLAGEALTLAAGR